MAQKRFQAPKGTYDILPQDQPYWDKFRKVFKKLADECGFQRIDTPLIEDANLFIKGIGLNTDIVEKQMFNLKTRGGDMLTLRPEGTAGVVRAFIENGLINLPQPLKLYYEGPMFRYERPQAGRFRQFYQFGVEVIGSQDAVLDAQIILFSFRFLQSLGIKKINAQVNSVGCSSCRSSYKKVLVDFYRSKSSKICVDCKRRLKLNPLRVLDCKEPKCQDATKDAPGIVDYLCDDCRDHFKNILEFLDELELPYFLNRNLVRGLDYYTKTVFEIWPDIEAGEKTKAQIALVGGGRYDGLMKSLGGKDMPGIGMAAGAERIIGLMKEREIKPQVQPAPLVFLVQLGFLAKKKSLKLFDQLQNAGIATMESFSRDSIKAQLKIADKLEAKFALILGQQEALDGTVIMRDMASGSQETLLMDINNIISAIKKKNK